MTEYEASSLDALAQNYDELITISQNLITISEYLQAFFLLAFILIAFIVTWVFVRRIVFSNIRSFIKFKI